MHPYLTRIELHHAVGLDYENLHALMVEAGFRRIITDGTGRSYHLPTGVYLIDDASLIHARDRAIAAAQQTGLGFLVFVVEFDRWVSYGLEAAD